MIRRALLGAALALAATVAHAQATDTAPRLTAKTPGGSGSFQLSACASGCNVGLSVSAAAYAAGQSLGGLITLTPGYSGVLVNLRLKSAAGATNSVHIYAWSKLPQSGCANGAAFTPSAADTPYALSGFPAQGTLGGAAGSWDPATYAQFQTLNSSWVNQDGPPKKAIYLCIVTDAAVTPTTTSDLSLIAAGLAD